MLATSTLDQERFQRYANQLAKFFSFIGNNKYAIVGSGNCAHQILEVIENKGYAKPVGLFDKGKEGCEVAGVCVKALESLPEDTHFVLLATFDFAAQIKDKLNQALPDRFEDLRIASIGDFDAYRKKRASKEPIVIVTIPKTGTEFIRRTLDKKLDIEGMPISEGEWPNLLTSEYAVGQCLKTSAMAVTHLQCTPYNMFVLKNKGIKKLVVQVRDPRQVTLSWLHHLEKIRFESNFRPEYFNVKNYFELSFEEKLDYQLKYELPEFCAATQRWLDLESNDDFDVKFMTFNYLKAQPQKYFQEIYDFFSIQGDVGEIDAPKPGKANFRKGQEDEWKSVFSDAQKAQASRLISSQLKDRFGWEN